MKNINFTVNSIFRFIRGETGRKVAHIAGAIFPIAYLLGISWFNVQILILVFLVVSIFLEIIRLHVGSSWLIYRYLLRNYEQDNFAGYTWYAISFSLVALLFRPGIALTAMFCLAFADPVAGLFSENEPRLIKSPLGLLSMFVICLPVAYYFLNPLPALFAATAAMLADGIFIKIGPLFVDDNLTIPIFTALAARLVYMLA